MNIDIKVGDKFRVAKEWYRVVGPAKFDTARIITVTRVGYAILWYSPRLNVGSGTGFMYEWDFVQLMRKGFLVRHDVQETSTQPAKATAPNTDNAVCNKCGGRTKGLFSEFNGPRYCPSCEK